MQLTYANEFENQKIISQFIRIIKMDVPFSEYVFEINIFFSWLEKDLFKTQITEHKNSIHY